MVVPLGVTCTVNTVLVAKCVGCEEEVLQPRGARDGGADAGRIVHDRPRGIVSITLRNDVGGP
jgi:hypothetical protein